MKELTPKELAERLAKSPGSIELIDVREPLEFAEIRLKSSKNLPLSSLSADAPEIDWTKDVVFVCRSWARSWRVSSAFEGLHKPSSNLAWWIASIFETFPDLLDFGP